MKILIAEDDPVSGVVLETLLRKLGHSVMACGDGDLAWRAYQQGDYRLVISDWMMPEIDGLELCRRIRESSRRDYCYFILATTRAEKKDLVEAMNAGVDDFVTKPLSLRDVETRLLLAERVLDRMEFRLQA